MTERELCTTCVRDIGTTLYTEQSTATTVELGNPPLTSDFVSCPSLSFISRTQARALVRPNLYTTMHAARDDEEVEKFSKVSPSKRRLSAMPTGCVWVCVCSLYSLAHPLSLSHVVLAHWFAMLEG